jgi:hypothetical protein
VVRSLTLRQCELIVACFALALIGPVRAAADPALRSLLVDLNARPLDVTKPDEDQALRRITSDSGSFSMLPSAGHSSYSRQHWLRRDPVDSWRSVFDLLLTHLPEGSWIWAHIGSRSGDGIPGVLGVITPYVRSFIIEYDPNEVISEVSLETYRGSVIYCGRIPDTHYRSSCSLGHVVLHGSTTIRFFVLIVANRPSQRDALLREFVSMLASIELHEPNRVPASVQ